MSDTINVILEYLLMFLFGSAITFYIKRVIASNTPDINEVVWKYSALEYNIKLLTAAALISYITYNLGLIY